MQGKLSKASGPIHPVFVLALQLCWTVREEKIQTLVGIERLGWIENSRCHASWQSLPPAPLPIEDERVPSVFAMIEAFVPL